MEHKVDKRVFINRIGDYLELKTGFRLLLGYSAHEDSVCNLFESIIDKLDFEIEEKQLIDERTVRLLTKLEPSLIGILLQKYNFNPILGVPTESLAHQEPLDTKTTRSFHGEKTDQKSLVFLGLDIKSYVKDGSLLRLNEKIADCPPLTVDTVLGVFLKSLIFKPSDRVIAISMIDFVSGVETSNKVLIRLNSSFKGEDRLLFLSKRRTSELIKTYSDVFVYERDVNEIVDGWRIVDAAKIYNFLYKFGTKNKKAYFASDRYYILKPFRSDYVLFLRRDIVDKMDDKEMLTIQIR
jgi:hypothetical protein